MKGKNDVAGRGSRADRSRYGSKDSRTSHGAGEMKPKETTGLIQELPVLTWGLKRSNFADFQESIQTYLEAQFANNGSFIKNDKYYVPPMPEEPEADPSPKASRSDQIAWSVYEDACKNRAKTISKHIEERTKMYSIIWGQLSTLSKDKIQNHTEFEHAEVDTDGRKDPLMLWRIIVSTHLVKATGNEDLDKDDAKEYYDRLQQGATETVANYKKRFERAIAALKQIGHPQIPTQTEQVIRFIKSLNDTNCYEWKNRKINDMREGITPPASLSDAARDCDNYVPLHSDLTYSSRGTTFMTRGGRGGRGRGSGGRGKNRNRNPDDKSRDEDEETEDKSGDASSSGFCYRCGSKDHYTKECTFKGECNKCGKRGHKASVCKSSRTTAMTRRVLITDSDDTQRDDDMYCVHIDNQSNENVFKTA